MKEVKKINPRSKNFYLSILESIKLGSNPAQIKLELGISKQALNYYISTLKKAGCIRKKGYGVWEFVKDYHKRSKNKLIRVAKITPYNLKPDMVRGHAFQFTLRLPENLRNWDKRAELLKKINIPYKELNLFGGGQAIEFKGRKIHLTNKSIVIYEKESFICELAKESYSQAVNHFLTIVKALERHLRANFSQHGKYKFRVTRSHYALIKNALAKQYDKDKKRLYVYSDKGLWFLIDNSFNLHEAETVHPKTSLKDNEMVQKHFNFVKRNDIEEILKETDERIKRVSEQNLKISQVLEQLNNNVVRLITNGKGK